MTKSLEERIADLEAFSKISLFSETELKEADFITRGKMEIFNEKLTEQKEIASQAMSVINDLQAKLKEETQRADLLSLENEKLKKFEKERWDKAMKLYGFGNILPTPPKD